MIKTIPQRFGIDLVTAQRRLYLVEKIGRDRTYAYVHDGFKRHLRSDRKYRQYIRLVNRLSIARMPQNERSVLRALGGIVMAAKIDRANIGKITSAA